MQMINRRQLAVWAGMIGPVLFVATFTIAGWARPGYNPTSTYVSELSIGSQGWIQILNFLIFGVLLLLFIPSLTAEFQTGKVSRAGPLLLTIIAISFLASGPLVADPATTLPDQMTLHGKLHAIFGALVFSLSPVSCFVFLRRFHEDPQWQSFQWSTLIAGILITVAVILLRIGPTRPPTPPSDFNEWAGLIQRIAIITYLSWLFLFAVRLYQHNKIAREGKI